MEGGKPIGPELHARFTSNWELSTARATEVVRRLVERGVSPGALEAVGRADTGVMTVRSLPTPHEAGCKRNHVLDGQLR